MNKFIFYKIWDVYDILDMKAGREVISLVSARRRDELPKPTEEMLKEFEQCKQDLQKRNEYLKNIGKPLIDEKYCRTDFETYCFENMMQLLRKVYSGYIRYEDSDIAITSSNSKLVAVYDVFSKTEDIVGIIEETEVPEVRRN